MAYWAQEVFFFFSVANSEVPVPSYLPHPCGCADECLLKTCCKFTRVIQVRKQKKNENKSTINKWLDHFTQAAMMQVSVQVQ